MSVNAVRLPATEATRAVASQSALGECVSRQESRGEPAVLLVPGSVRAAVARLVRHSVPSLAVLAYAEVPEDKRLRLVGAVG